MNSAIVSFLFYTGHVNYDNVDLHICREANVSIIVIACHHGKHKRQFVCKSVQI